MGDKFILGAGQAHELEMAFRRTGWTNAEIKELTKGATLTQVRQVIRKLSTIEPIQHLIDCDADPFLPRDFKVEEHIKGGILVWDPTKAGLYLSEKQRGRKRIMGIDLRKELANQLVMNANVLDYLLAHPELIPEDWGARTIFFWGTIYRSSGHLLVRYLFGRDGGWHWGHGWMSSNSFDSSQPIAVRIA